MSSASFGTAKDEIRQAINIVDLVGSYLDLRRQGSGYVALCPWHDDSKPSLQVNPARQIWKCWVCGIGGDIFSFIMRHEGVEFREALKLLADRAGIQLTQQKQRPITPGSPDDKAALLAATAWAEKQFHEYLLKSEAAEVARQYLEDRGITPASVEKFNIGFSPDSFTWLLDRSRNTPHSPAVLEAVDLVGKSERGTFYDRFRGRVIFPIRDAQSRPIAFGGRVLPSSKDQGGKYVNSRETKLFSKREQLYALDLASKAARKSRHLTVVEGYTDVVLCHQFGVDDVVACLGTALGEGHIPLLRRFADTITLLLDGDEAGQKRTNDILELFVTATIDLRVLTLPDELDPADFLLEYGATQFNQLLKEKSVDALEHKIRVATHELDIARETHRASTALEEILATLAKYAMARGADPKSLRTQQLIARLARQFLVEETFVRERYNQLCQVSREAKRPVIVTSAPASTSQIPLRPEFKLNAISMDEIELLEILVAHYELAGTALSELGELDLSADATKVIFRTYRQLEEAGESLDFGRVLAEIEDAQLKSLMVQLVEVADRKASKANLDPPTRLRHLLQKIHRGHEQRIIREKEEYLQLPEANDQQKHDVFLEILEAKRRQQGLIAPTDG
ncbi:DNA primase [Anatilimnocola aggregata]|uniref:DNA primase n=1 Tax=Anatilimnocola aggregata TaxID=2528021 RepID=A0A517YKY2_9BACT|nr:DNA primase [Anatilimnocola aggregata]QDU30854.1 DNA primase [Anatilimnocola aggregata]